MRWFGSTAAMVAAAVLLPACGPTVDLSIRVRQEPADVQYGGSPRPTPSPLGPRTAPPSTGTNAPGFIAPPVFTGGIPTGAGATASPTLRPSGAPLPSAPPPPTEACPTAPADAVPGESAPSTIQGAPPAGTLTYRRTGGLAVAPDDTTLKTVKPTPLSGELRRTIRDVQSVPVPDGGEQTTYYVVTEEPGIVTTINYLVVPPADDDTSAGGSAPTGGMYIRSIETKVTGPDGHPTFDSFSPNPPVKLFDLPFVPQTFDGVRRATTSVDPITGARMDVFYATEGQVTVDLCGKLYRAWRVRLGQDKGSDQAPTPVSCNYSVPFRHGWQFTGTLDILPQFGGLIVRDDMHFFNGQTDKNQRFELTSNAVATSVTPEAASP